VGDVSVDIENRGDPIPLVTPAVDDVRIVR
jgi:hypothetical protein